ncbi:MAG: ERF family protein [Fastidiosipila sp.]|nr:ERF family protein [Fastidiosipila sp.]
MTNIEKTKRSLQEKIIEVQSRLKAPKGQWNAFSKFNYRSAEDILEALKPLLAEVGLLQTISDEVLLIGDRYYIRATVTVKHEDEELCVTAYAREAESKKGMDESQITGTASSYARKYALNGLWAIDDTKDADTDEHHRQTQSSSNKSKGKPAPKATAEVRKYIQLKEVATM